jgi:hypothetical protein
MTIDYFLILFFILETSLLIAIDIVIGNIIIDFNFDNKNIYFGKYVFYCSTYPQKMIYLNW